MTSIILLQPIPRLEELANVINSIAEFVKGAQSNKEGLKDLESAALGLMDDMNKYDADIRRSGLGIPEDIPDLVNTLIDTKLKTIQEFVKRASSKNLLTAHLSSASDAKAIEGHNFTLGGQREFFKICFNTHFEEALNKNNL